MPSQMRMRQPYFVIREHPSYTPMVQDVLIFWALDLEQPDR